MTTPVPRGIRNNNPGNIRKSAIVYRGESGGSDPDFKTFISPTYGIRAIAVILLAYQKEHGLATIRQMISRWAPASENDTDAYVSDVAAEAGIGPDESVTLCTQSDILGSLIEAIIHHENGQQPYPQATVAVAVELAIAA